MGGEGGGFDSDYMTVGFTLGHFNALSKTF